MLEQSLLAPGSTLDAAFLSASFSVPPVCLTGCQAWRFRLDAIAVQTQWNCRSLSYMLIFLNIQKIFTM